MFEKAARQKVRFQYKGMQTVEEIWDLDVREVDKIYTQLKSEQKKTEEESLLQKPSRAKSLLSLKVEIVKHIVEVKLAEQEASQQRVDKKAKKQQLLEILNDKKLEATKNLSVKELEKQIEEL